MNLVRECIYVAIIITLIALIYTGCEKNKQAIASYIAVSDSLHKTHDAFKRETAQTAVIYSSYRELKRIHTDDSTVNFKLKKIVDRLTQSASVISNVTTNNFTAATEKETLSGDTAKSNSIINECERYHTSFSNSWERFDISANCDSFKVNYKVFNEFELTQEWKRNGLFGRKTLQASIKNLNPNTETLHFKTYTLSENRNNRLRDFLFGVAAGSLLTAGTSIYLNRVIK